MNALRNIISSLATISLAVTLTSCTAAHTTPTRLSENTVQNKLKPGEAGVYILRADSSFYNTPLLAIDDKPAGAINSSSYVFARLRPGMHQISINQGYLEGTVHYQFQVKPGQATYLNMGWGKLPKNQNMTPSSTNPMFVLNRGWVIATMNEQAANHLLTELNSGNTVRLD